MLIILSGLETIHKKFFSREIIATLNKFKIDDYAVDFINHNVKIYNPANELVYQYADAEYPDGITTLLLNAEDGSSNDAGREILNRATVLADTIFNNSVRDNHFANIFADPLYDFGLIPTQVSISDTPLDKQYLQPHTYQTVLTNYNARTFENFVITGVFSKGFIEKIKSDIGESNVTVLNIIRNPSICFVLNEKDPDYYDAIHPTLERTPLMDDNKLTDSILTASILKEMPGVDTQRFEDILKEAAFYVNGVKISIPPGYTPFNNVLTNWENENIIPMNIISSDAVDAFNSRFTNYYAVAPLDSFTDVPTSLTDKQATIDVFNNMYGSTLSISVFDELSVYLSSPPIKWQDILTIFNAVHKSSTTLEQFTALFSMNLFTKLGYESYTHAEIVFAG